MLLPFSFSFLTFTKSRDVTFSDELRGDDVTPQLYVEKKRERGYINYLSVSGGQVFSIF